MIAAGKACATSENARRGPGARGTVRSGILLRRSASDNSHELLHLQQSGVPRFALIAETVCNARSGYGRGREARRSEDGGRGNRFRRFQIRMLEQVHRDGMTIAHQIARSTARPALRGIALLLIFALAAGMVTLAAFPAGAQGNAGTRPTESLLRPIRTDSPRATMESFLRLRDELETASLDYLAAPDRAGAATLMLLSDQFNSLIDLGAVPAASRRETGVRTYSLLMDIFGRIGAPDLAALPDLDVIEDTGDATFRIPGTPLRLVRMPEGEREGEFLFAASTVQIAPWFLETIRDLPLESRLDTDSIASFGKQLTGPLIPAAVVEAVPPSLKRLWLDTPIWKAGTLLAVIAILAASLAGLHRALSAWRPAHRARAILSRAILPAAILAVTTTVLPFLAGQLNISGRFANALAKAETVVEYAALAWLLWLAVRFAFEWLIRPLAIPDDTLDADMLRLLSSTLGIVGATIVLAMGGQAIGLPVLSVLAGLGIGGLAVALAVRPTLENLIGGVILYVDRPVSVGDFCSFGDQMGTVESVGIRSTKLRALDRTLISVPNAQFADMQIVNWAECDEMLIQETLGLRYETTADQLRYVLAELRRMLHAHPRISSETVRVRFWGYGASEIRVNVRVYAATREWNDFFAIREDVFFRVLEIVRQSGTDFALQSQTLYLGRDPGVDVAKGRKAEETVEGWRRKRALPFPRLTPEELERIDGTLDYPPRGSHEAGAEDLASITGAEPLSTPETADAGHPEDDSGDIGARGPIRPETRR
jgi:MscS family membrane protein